MNADDPTGARRFENRSLEPDPAGMRQWIDAVGDHVVRHIASLPDQHAGYTDSPFVDLPAVGPPPESPGDMHAILERLFNVDIPKSFNTAGPGYLAYIPGGGLFHAAIAEFIAAAVNRYVGVFAAAPRLVAIEAEVVRWFAEFIGYPAAARGILTTGGSMSNFSAIVAARVERLGDRFFDGVMYVTEHAHHSIRKSAMLAGFRPDQVRIVPTDSDFRMRVDLLESMIDDDRSAQRRPFLLTANAGTTNTGAVDDLSAVADLAARRSLWMHVDAAYGGFFCLTRSGKETLRGIERADSVTLDPHKGLFLPYGTGALLVRDGAVLRRAHSMHADYLPPTDNESSHPSAVDFCEYSPELSRSFRGLSVWLPIVAHGLGPFRDNLEEKLLLARRAYEFLGELPDIEIVAAPQLSITAFRIKREGWSFDATNDLNRRFLDRILAGGRIWITHTLIDKKFVLRICVLSFRTHLDRLDEGLRQIAEARAHVLSERGRNE